MKSLIDPIRRFLTNKKVHKRAVIAIATVSVLAISYFKIFELYELQTYDWRFKMRGQRPVSKEIVLIDIWDDTLEELGWPFDRKYHAKMIDALSSAGAKAVMFDILFVEPKDSDPIVAESAKKAGNVYFAHALDTPKSLNGHVYSDKILEPLLTSYSESAKAVGSVNVVADIDGKRRRVPLIINSGNKDYFHFTLQVVSDVLGIPKERISLKPGHSIELSDRLSLPLDEDGYFIVNFSGAWAKTFEPHYSFLEVLRSYEAVQKGEAPIHNLGLFKDKICIIGHTATATHDANANPLETVYPNVGIHANIINSILQKDFISRATRIWNLIILVFLCGCIAWISSRKRPILALLYAVSTVVLFLAVSCGLFFQWGFWIDLFYPLLVCIVLYTAMTLTRALLEIRKREVIESELKIASQIQKSFLPETLPKKKGISVAVYMKPAKAVGGDLYTFLSPSPDKLGVMVGDVSGKGTPAALFMAKAVSEFKFSAREKTDPAEVLFSLNNSIASESTGGLFVTLVYTVFDLAARKLLLSNAGHLPVVLARKDGSAQLLTADDGMPVGVMGDVPFSSFEIEIKDGDCLALYSDGVSEARNLKKEEFSVETLQEIMVNNQSKTSQEILDRVILRLNSFMGKADQHDDITLIIVKIDASVE